MLALRGLKVDSDSIFESFLEAGGICAIVRVVMESDCPVTCICTASFIQRLLDSQYGLRKTPSWSSEIADLFLQAGEWVAFLHPH